MKKFTDQLGREVVISNFPPLRIVSLVPSQTELLYDLGLKGNIVGQTVFCIYPECEFKNAVKIGGTKKLNMNKIHQLQPDLIIGNKEENMKTEIDALAKHFPVWMSDIYTFEDALNMISSVGEITNTSERANQLIVSITVEFGKIEQTLHPQTVVYLIWQKPYMAAGSNTYIDNMLKKFGYLNLITEERYPQISIESISNLQPDLVLLSTEPFPFTEIHVKELQSTFSDCKVQLIDAEMTSWYGSKLLKVPEYILQYQTTNKKST